MSNSLYRVCLLLLLALPAYAEPKLPPLPPLTSPATSTHLPGKFVWADLFSDNLERSRQFYEGLFGWQLRWISEPPQPYGIFSVDGVDVAGLAYRDMENASMYARWVHYISVSDVGNTESAIASIDGRTLLHETVPDRGEFAIFSFPSHLLLGVMHSSSGDPEDFRAEEGEWIWHQLYVHDLDTTITHLRQLTDFEIEMPQESDEVDRLLVSHGYLRGGLAQLPADSKAGPTWLGFIRVKDVAGAVARATALGGKVQHTADTLDMAIVSDPQGALIGLLNYDFPDEEPESEEGTQ